MAVEIPVKFDIPDVSNVNKAIGGIDKKAKKAGKKSGKQFSSGFKLGLGSVAAIAATAATAIAGVLGSKKIIDLASQQEDAVRRLNSALAQSGDFSEQASKSIQQFASDLQSVTRFGDEVILNQVALAKSFGATNDQAQDIVRTATDMAEALGIDLESATRNAAKTLGGYAGELGEVIPELKNLTQEQLRAGAGIDVLSKKFEGFAENNVKTFSGATQQLANAFGDVLEKLGKASPTVIAIINKISESLVTLADKLENALKSDFIGDAIKNLTAFLKSNIVVISTVVEVFRRGFSNIANIVSSSFRFAQRVFDIFYNTIGETALNVVRAVRDAVVQIVTFIVNLVKKTFNALLPAINKVLSFLGKKVIGIAEIVDPDLASDLSDFGSEAGSAFSDAFGEFTSVAFEPFDPTATQEKLTAILGQITAFSESVVPVNEAVKNSVNASGKALGGLGAKAKETAKVVNNTINQALTKTASLGIQALTKSLALGEKGFENFGKTISGVLGDMAIQLGETLVLTGLGMEALKGLGGTAAIAAGVGLIALGTILKSFSGGEGAGASPVTGNAGGFGGGVTGESTELATDAERQDPEKRVTVNIEGNYFDTQESRLELVNLFNKAVETDGARVVTA